MTEMMNIPTSLLCYFTATIREEDGVYVIEVPENELDIGSLEVDSQHKVAVFGSKAEHDQQTVVPSESEIGPGPTPPVRKGETHTLEIVDQGAEGDGIARVNEGYIVIIPEGVVGETVTVEIIAVKEKFAIGETTETTD